MELSETREVTLIRLLVLPAPQLAYHQQQPSDTPRTFGCGRSSARGSVITVCLQAGVKYFNIQRG